MTHTTDHRTRAAALRRRLTVGLLAAATVFGVSTLDQPGEADAAPRSKSEVVAAEADRALDALTTWQSTQSPAAYVQFVQARHRTASLTASDLGLASTQLSQEWQAASTTKQRALLAALSQLGVPYRSMQSKPGVGFDCSGLTIWAFDQAGVGIPRTSGDQIRAAERLEKSEAEAGDLVYYPGHVGIYLGADMMVHSPNTGSHVEARGLPTKHSLRFGDIAVDGPDAEPTDRPVSPVELVPPTLVDRAGSVAQ